MRDLLPRGLQTVTFGTSLGTYSYKYAPDNPLSSRSCISHSSGEPGYHPNSWPALSPATDERSLEDANTAYRISYNLHIKIMAWHGNCARTVVDVQAPVDHQHSLQALRQVRYFIWGKMEARTYLHDICTYCEQVFMQRYLPTMFLSLVNQRKDNARTW